MVMLCDAELDTEQLVCLGHDCELVVTHLVCAFSKAPFPFQFTASVDFCSWGLR